MGILDGKGRTRRLKRTLAALQRTDRIRQKLLTSIGKNGRIAPHFTLPATTAHSISLQSLLGNPIILAFYPADWTPVCTDQLGLYNEVLPLFAAFEAQLLAISVDSVACHQAFADAHKLRFPLLADFEPKGSVSQAYGVYDEATGISRRAIFVIDEAGMIAWSQIYPYDMRPGVDGILKALELLRPLPKNHPSWQVTLLPS